jgi:hypothetical protein
MGRRWKVLLVVVAVAGGWLAFGKDATRERVVASMTDVAGRAMGNRTAAANWGDVARKIGDFAAEERGLKDSVSRAEKAAPPVAP